MPLREIILFRKHSAWLLRPADIAQIPKTALRDHLSLRLKAVSAFLPIDPYSYRPTRHNGFILRNLYVEGHILTFQVKPRLLVLICLVMPGFHQNIVLGKRDEVNGDRRDVLGVSPV